MAASGNIDLVSRHIDELAREVEALQGELEEARARASQQETALAHLDEQRGEATDRLELAQRQISDLGRQVTRREVELEEARQQALYDTFVEALQRRDETALEAAARLDAAMGALSTLNRRREEASAALADVPARFEASVPDEPLELDEAWEELVALVRANLDSRLEDELVHAAATSPAGRAIQDLPAHLREVAIQRRRELQKRARHAHRHSEPS